jgi:hypothetical protein
MAKLIIHAYTQDKNNPTLKTAQELLTTVSNSLGGFIAWIDLVDETNNTSFEYEALLEEE